MRPARTPAAVTTLVLGLGLLAGCTAGATPDPAPVPSPSPAPASGSTPTPAVPTSAAPTSAAPAEPTTTNTLPPPPDPTGPAPSTAGDLDAAQLPVPQGWRTVAREGGEEEGFEGNGTWVHARDPRYAAQDVITIGCLDVTRDDYTDPVAALEGNYENASGAPGIGLALEFGDDGAAARYWERYTAQVRACQTLDDPVRTTLVDVGAGGAVADGDTLVDRRTYPDGAWTEVARRVGTRVTLVILNDEGRRLSTAQAGAVLAQIG